MGEKLPTKLNRRQLTRQQEAFCALVAQDTPPTEAVEQIYPDNTRPSRNARELLDSAKVTNRVEVLENQSNVIAELNRDSLTVRALEIEGLATEDGKFSAGVSALRLAGDLQGLTTSNPVAEDTHAFLAFLAGDGGKPAVEGEVRVLGEGSGAPSS